MGVSHLRCASALRSTTLVAKEEVHGTFRSPPSVDSILVAGCPANQSMQQSEKQEDWSQSGSKSKDPKDGSKMGGGGGGLAGGRLGHVMSWHPLEKRAWYMGIGQSDSDAADRLLQAFWG
ncbi:hypothetical protein PG984_003070 [Apiospora sp. TS-2023a]